MIYNLTLHELTSEQIEALSEFRSEFGEVDPEPRGCIFENKDANREREDWVRSVLLSFFPDEEAQTPRDVAFIVGGDTAAFMMLSNWVRRIKAGGAREVLQLWKEEREEQHKRTHVRHFAPGDPGTEMTDDQIEEYRKRVQCLGFLYAITDRSRDEYGRFVFVHKGWELL